jgi:uncharacterized PurR-regulated membrane protein YhhQ (DUF165 family)
MNRTLTGLLVVAYLFSIVAANWAIAHLGTPPEFPGAPHTLPVGFGLTAPSGVYFVGLTLVLRDEVQRRLGVTWSLGVIAVGAVIVATFAPSLALASVIAFAVAELVDLGTYSFTEKRWGHRPAILTSNAVSIVVDSLVFLTIAFGSLAYIQGQVAGKTWATLAGFAVIYVLMVRRNRQVVPA